MNYIEFSEILRNYAWETWKGGLRTLKDCALAKSQAFGQAEAFVGLSSRRGVLHYAEQWRRIKERTGCETSASYSF